MIKIEIYEDSGQLTVNQEALDFLTEEEYHSLDELGKVLRSRMKHGAPEGVKEVTREKNTIRKFVEKLEDLETIHFVRCILERL